MQQKDIKSMTRLELEEDFEKEGYEKYRARQVFNWLTKGVFSFDEMSNVPVSMRELLKKQYFIYKVEERRKLVSERDETVKYLFMLFDGALVEAVLMKYKHGYSVCISTQVGCKMGCAFCATGKGKFLRNLYPSEMLSEIQYIQNDNNIRVSNVVLMGMGEPLDNYDNVLKFLQLVSSKDGLNIGMRHISVSTCGMVDKIYSLAEEKLQLTLSVSLHAAKNNLRSSIMPINKRWNVDDLIEACKYYIDKTGRRISFEYIMIKGVNDSNKDAADLSNLLKGMLCHINLIPANNISESNFRKSDLARIREFSGVLNRSGLNATVRRVLGPDINASCGQLRQGEVAAKEE